MQRFSLEMKKDALRQNQDGSYKVTFNIHPSDMHVELLTAPMGTRYYAELVDAEGFDNQGQQDDARNGTGFASDTVTAHTPDGDSGPPPYSQGHQKETNIVTQAVLISQDGQWNEYVSRAYPSLIETGPDAMRKILGVTSRSELARNENAAETFMRIKRNFYDFKNYGIV